MGGSKILGEAGSKKFNIRTDIFQKLSLGAPELFPSVTHFDTFLCCHCWTTTSLRATSPIWAIETSRARTRPLSSTPRSRENAPPFLDPSLARSREARFACPNKRACSQARPQREISLISRFIKDNGVKHKATIFFFLSLVTFHKKTFLQFDTINGGFKVYRKRRGET